MWKQLKRYRNSLEHFACNEVVKEFVTIKNGSKSGKHPQKALKCQYSKATERTEQSIYNASLCIIARFRSCRTHMWFKLLTINNRLVANALFTASFETLTTILALGALAWSQKAPLSVCFVELHFSTNSKFIDWKIPIKSHTFSQKFCYRCFPNYSERIWWPSRKLCPGLLYCIKALPN